MSEDPVAKELANVRRMLKILLDTANELVAEMKNIEARITTVEEQNLHERTAKLEKRLDSN